MMFWPLSDARPGLGSTFIIDLWFSGIILAGLLVSIFFRKSRVPAIAAAAVLVGYVFFQTMQKEKAVEFGREYARNRGIAGADVTAHPRPVSPYNWTVFVSDAREHRYAHVNLVREAPRSYQPGDGFVAKLDAPYLPVTAAQWQVRSRYGDKDAAREAWESPALGFMRWFAERPALDASTTNPECHWFLDLRFVNPGRDWVPFRFGACRDDARDGKASPWRAVESTPP